jgi:hypothetical protein
MGAPDDTIRPSRAFSSTSDSSISPTFSTGTVANKASFSNYEYKYLLSILALRVSSNMLLSLAEAQIIAPHGAEMLLFLKGYIVLPLYYLSKYYTSLTGPTKISVFLLKGSLPSLNVL